jgi:DNA-directed RNA polymerase specialized sigma54-like protein
MNSSLILKDTSEDEKDTSEDEKDILDDDVIAIGKYTKEDFDRYRDPEDEETVLDIINDVYTSNDILKFTKEHFPRFVIKEIENYSSEMSRHQNVWKSLCRQLKTEPKTILLVEIIIADDKKKKYQIIRHVCDHLTRNGYCVRSVQDLKECSLCGECVVIKRKMCIYCRLEGNINKPLEEK